MTTGGRQWWKKLRPSEETILGSWEYTELPEGHKAIGLKWVYKIKKNPESEIVKHKARLVAKGYVQRRGVDFNKVFAPVAHMETVQRLLTLAAQEGWQVHHLDVKSVFLNRELEEEVYVVQPQGFEDKNQEGKVLKLRKALYGLHQAPRAWNAKLDQCLRSLGLEKCPQEHSVYKITEGRVQVVGVVTGSSIEEMLKFKHQMKKQIEMSDLGLLSYYLGIEVKQDSQGIHLKQSTYAMKILEKVGLADCNPCHILMEPRAKMSKVCTSPPVDATMYRSVIGSLIYLVN